MNISDFDPDGTGVANGNYFGLPFDPEECRLVLLSAPWDVTTSYGGGASFGPDAIIEASTQVDLYDRHNPDGWLEGIGTVGIDYSMQDRSAFMRPDARRVIGHLEQGGEMTDHFRRKLARINEGSAMINVDIYEQSRRWLGKGKLVGLVGGDHSVPFGLIKAVAEKEGKIGVLHVDAHADLREAYEGFEHSHASIMYNVMTQVEGVEKLVQVALRDMCTAELHMAENSGGRIVQFSDYDINEAMFGGETWAGVCSRIVAQLPSKVYISFDIDGLSPDLCPGTGTPVPGGLSFHQAVYLLSAVAASGRTIVGFDLCEVSPRPDDEWDANVGARMLYKLCNIALLKK